MDKRGEEMRVLHIAHYDVYPRSAETFINNTRNGLEQCLDSMIKNMSDVEHFVLFFNHYENTIFIQKIDANGIATIYSYYGPTTYNESELRAIFREILEDFSPNIVHIHYLQEYIKVLPKILNELDFSAIITTMHDESFLGENYGMNQEYAYDESVNEFLAYNKRVVFLHEVSLQRFEKFYKDQLLNKTCIIPNGIDLEKVNTHYNKSDKLRVLFLGAFNFEKGIEIIKELAKKNSDELEIILLGTVSEQIEDLIDKGAYTRNNLAKKVKEINPDIIALPSIVEEVFPYTALEATAMGYPIICFSVGSLQKVEDENRGFVVIEKTVDAFYQKLQEIADIKDNSEEWLKILQKIGERRQVSVSEMVEQYHVLYQKYSNKSNSGLDIEHIFQRNLQYQKMKEQFLFEKEQKYQEMLLLYNKEGQAAYEFSKENALLKAELERIPSVMKKIANRFKKR